MRWPGQIPAGSVCREIAATIDLLPTIAKLAGTKPPTDRVIDGKDIWPLMSGQPNAKSPHEAYCFYGARDLQAIRSGRWKLHFPHRYRSYDRSRIPTDGHPVEYVFPEIGLSLFDLENDIGETTNVADEHPEVVRRLTALADRFREDLGDAATNHPGKNIPPARQKVSRIVTAIQLRGFNADATGEESGIGQSAILVCSTNRCGGWPGWDGAQRRKPRCLHAQGNGTASLSEKHCAWSGLIAFSLSTAGNTGLEPQIDATACYADSWPRKSRFGL